MGIWWYSSSKHGFLIHWLIIYTNECLVRLSSYLCVRVCVCMRDTANISMINTQHTTLPVKDSTVYFSWNQNKAHGHYLQLCTVCVCVCVLACVWVCQGRLSSDSSVDAFTGRQWTDASWEEETVAFVVRALWLWGLSHRSSGELSSLCVCP